MRTLTPLRAQGVWFAIFAGHTADVLVKMKENRAAFEAGRPAYDVWAKEPGQPKGKKIGTVIYDAAQPFYNETNHLKGAA